MPTYQSINNQQSFIQSINQSINQSNPIAKAHYVSLTLKFDKKT